MRQRKSGCSGFSALEAAIVLIAFVVVAALFFYIVIGFTNQGNTIQVAGNVYGLATVPSSGINEIRFSIRLVPGEKSMNLTKMAIVFSTPATRPVTLSEGPTASTSVFTTRLNGAGDSVSSIDQDQQIEVDFFIANVSANTTMNFDMRPPAGALSFSRTAPATITNTNVL